jgi:magnesium chelatase family protein
VVVPSANAAEARLVPGAQVLAATTLPGVIAALRRPWPASCDQAPELDGDDTAGGSSTALAPRPGLLAARTGEGDLADVVGQPLARRLVEIAAAGGHHLLLSGPPGGGKTMLARRLPGLLPPLDLQAALEVSAVHSVAGLLPADHPLVRHAPFVDPHHTCSAAALVGGGSGLPRPGAVSLAHRGVLLMDEAPEFTRTALESLRQPLERGEVLITRSRGHARFPAAFQLVLTANPCPCGFAGSVTRPCACPPDTVRRYQHRLSGPLLDRIDLHGLVGPVSQAALAAEQGRAESSAVVQQRVVAARERQSRRFAEQGWSTNATAPPRLLRQGWPVAAGAEAPVVAAVTTGRISARGADRVLRVAWTIADLAGVDQPGPDHVAEALAHHRGEPLRAVA